MRCSFWSGKSWKIGVKSCVNWYDYGARFYDASLGRFHTIDPSAENYLSHSSYAYVLNNPMNLIDPDGRDARVSSSTDSTGNVTHTIQSTIYITGKGASEKRADKLNEQASKTLTSQTIENEDGTTTTVEFDVNYVYAEDTKDITLGQGDNILVGLTSREAKSMGVGYSRVLSTTRTQGNGDIIEGAGKTGYMVGGFGNTVTIHESLHMLGLSDRYKEGSVTINGIVSRTTTPNSGYENDIMGASSSSKVSRSHYVNYVNYFNGKGNFILRQRVDKNKQGGLLP